jgi:hypothetical protein
MPISKKRGLLGGTKITFKCPTCGATMPLGPALGGASKVVCKSCASAHALSEAEQALLREGK